MSIYTDEMDESNDLIGGSCMNAITGHDLRKILRVFSGCNILTFRHFVSHSSYT